MHLVPFGEYVPLQKLLPFVNKLVAGIGDFSPGARITPLNTGRGEIGVLVCFEGIFPELAREYVRAGSRLLVNITNDAWFGRSSAPYQHLSMTVFRAVENRVPLVRAANTGISSIIDAKGHIRGMTPLFQEAFLSGEVRFGEGNTFYNRYGDLFAWLCLAGSGVIVVQIFRNNKKREE
jgi:apolipoprotein N-acyltransferase